MDVSSRQCCKNFIAIVLLLSAIHFTYSQNYGNADKLHIDILYESRCPDSRNFMQYQLKRAYPKIKDKVELNFIPFGKANSYNYNGELRFNCQHGSRECEGNVFQSCVLDAIGSDRQDIQTQFVICAMDFSKSSSNCAQNLGIDLNRINECARGDKGKELQLKAEKDSTPIIQRSFFVPTIVYNNIYNAADFWESLDDFEAIVDDKLRKLS